MKTPWEATAELWSACDSDVGAVDVAIAIKARDAEHAAQLAAAERTIEQLGQDAAAIAGRLDRAVVLIKRVPYRAAGDKWIEDRNAFLAPSQPEPVKAPLNDPGPHDCVFDDDGLCRIGSRTEMHREGPIVPENAGTACAACKGWAYQGKGTK